MCQVGIVHGILFFFKSKIFKLKCTAVLADCVQGAEVPIADGYFARRGFVIALMIFRGGDKALFLIN